MKTINVLLIAILFSLTYAQETKVTEAELKVKGNCEMCKKRIEQSLKIDEVKFAKWNKKTKTLKVAFLSSVSLDSLEHRIAASGHDTENFTAPDSVYKSLPACCLYRDSNHTH